jgi:signal transduction histidine kinase
MDWTYTYTPHIWIPFGTVLLLLAMAIYCWRRRNVPGALPFTFGLLFAALWAAGSLLEDAAADPATRIGWVKFQAVWQIPSATAVTFFLLEYAWPKRWLTRRNLVLLSIVPLLVLLVILTNDLHHLMWSSFVFTDTVTSNTLTPILGPVGWIALTYGYAFVIVNFVVFAWLFMHSPQHRWFVVLMVIGQLGFRVTFLLEKTHTLQSTLPLDIFGMVFAYLMYTYALFRFHVLDPVHLAHQAVLTQMREGMLVLDALRRVARLNPAAVSILGLSDKQAFGRRIQELIPAYSNPAQCEAAESEFSLGVGVNTRSYLLTDSPLKDWRGKEAGRLLLLHDMTEQKLAQSQLVEQQRSLAMLSEREHTARELHDELSQELSFINVQAQTIDDLLASGKVEQASTQLQLLAQIARSAHVDVRGQITKLSFDMVPSEGFVGALQRFLVEFERMYGICSEFILTADPLELCLEPTAEVQLLRITQEALTNTRKHAHANRICVSLERDLHDVTLAIHDDGAGFHPDEHSDERRTFGLNIMAERAAEIGGNLIVQSAPGQGTRVVVKVPVKGRPGEGKTRGIEIR